MSPSPGGRPQSFDSMVRLSCPECGRSLDAERDVEVFPCPGCRRCWSACADRLLSVPASSAQVTSLVDPGAVRHLAFWRYETRAVVRAKRSGTTAPPDAVWRQISQAAERAWDRGGGGDGDGGEAGKVFLYVPAFTLDRTAVRQLGSGMLGRQPVVRLSEGAPETVAQAPYGGAPSVGDGAARTGVLPAAGTFPAGWISPVILGEDDARTVAHFVYLAVESEATPDLRGIDYELHLEGPRLVYVPADYDVRYVRDSNWRILLREFDSLVV